MVTHMSPWLEPKGPLKRREELENGFGEKYSKEWTGMVGESFAEPWKNDKPQYPLSHAELHSVWAKTGQRGWWTLKYAAQALKRLKKASQEGKLNYKDSYNKVTQAVRYEFRILEVKISKSTRVATADDFIKVA